MLVLPLVWVLRAWHALPRIDTVRCRFHPTCAEYAITALQRFGLMRGTALAVGRLGRCHPWNPGGVDHVPERANVRASAQTPGPTKLQTTAKVR